MDVTNESHIPTSTRLADIMTHKIRKEQNSFVEIPSKIYGTNLKLIKKNADGSVVRIRDMKYIC